MSELTVQQYDALERAIIHRTRIAIRRRGTEFVIVPESLTLLDGREAISTRHPTTGAPLTIFLDETDSLEILT